MTRLRSRDALFAALLATIVASAGPASAASPEPVPS